MPEQTMGDPVVSEFAPEAKAEPVDMQKGCLIALGDAVVAVKQPNGRVKLKQLLHPTAFGAASSMLWGMRLIRTMLTAKVAEAFKDIGGKLLRCLTTPKRTPRAPRSRRPPRSRLEFAALLKGDNALQQSRPSLVSLARELEAASGIAGFFATRSMRRATIAAIFSLPSALETAAVFMLGHPRARGPLPRRRGRGDGNAGNLTRAGACHSLLAIINNDHAFPS